MRISIRNYEYDSTHLFEYSLLISVVLILCISGWFCTISNYGFDKLFLGILFTTQLSKTDEEKSQKELLGPPSNFFFLTSAYFVHGDIQLMSNLTDNQFYPSAFVRLVVYTLEQRWEILRRYFLLFWQKNHLFR